MSQIATRETLAPYVPRLVATWGADGGGHRALDCSLVSVDVSGFTALSERLAAKGKLGAEELIRKISDSYAGLIDITTGYGGDVLKFRGDALLLLFADPGHELRATAAALDMQAFIAETGETQTTVGPVRLGIACGVQSGVCDFFLVGSSHRELIVAGPAATAVLGLEDAANGGEILVSAATASALDPRALGEERAGARVVIELAELAAPPPPPEPLSFVRLDELVPGPLRQQLLSGNTEAEHRQATVAFVKYSGTDVLAGDALNALRELGTIVGSTADEFGVTWLESDIDADGGKLYLVAGAPSSAGEDEERMLRTLRRILDADTALKVCAGANRGRVFAGEIGSPLRRTYAVMGDTVNVAARLAGRAEKGQLLASEAVLDYSSARWSTVGKPVLMKGKARPVTAHTVGVLVEARSPEADLLPLIGREEEVAILQEALDLARRRRTAVVELVGEPGIGKSRLVEELKLRAVGFQQLVTRCEPYSSSDPYFPFRPLLRPLAGLTAEDDAVTAGERLRDWVIAVMPDLAQWLPLLAIPFDATVPPTPEVDEIGTAFRRDRLHDVVEQFLSRVLLMPTVIVFEDAHWIDEASCDLAAHLTASETPRPWLVCVTRREGRGCIVGSNHGRIVRLEPLTADQSMKLALAATDAAPLSEQELGQLAERAGGNPLFVRELLAAWTGDGFDDLPPTVETVITARIDTLAPVDRLLLRCAAVIGPRFDVDLLEEVLVAEGGDVGDISALGQLHEFLAWEDGHTVSFRHDLFRTVGYEGLSYKRRRELHAVTAEALERRGGEPSLLALHFREAGDDARAWRYAVAAGDTARQQYATIDAIESYARALASAEHLAELDPSEVARVAEALGDACELAGRYEAAATAFQRARDLLAADQVGRARLLFKEGELHERTGSYDEASDWQLRALGLLDENGLAEPELRARVELMLAGVRFRQARYAECVEWGERAVEHAAHGAAHAVLAHAYYLLDAACTQLGRPQLHYRELALPMFQEIGDLVGEAKVLNNLGYGAYFEGRWEEALLYWRQSGDASTRAGDVVTTAHTRMNEGEILSDQGRLDEAEHLFEEVLRVYRAAGFAAGVAFATGNLGRAAARAGRFDDAHRLLTDALGQFDDLGAVELVLEASARIAECFVLEGHHQEALRMATDTLANAESIEGLAPLRAMLERLLGYALHQSREFEQAQRHFAESLVIARGASAQYEVALTLRAAALTTGNEEAADESQALLDSLGVVALPYVPLP